MFLVASDNKFWVGNSDGAILSFTDSGQVASIEFVAETEEETRGSSTRYSGELSTFSIGAMVQGNNTIVYDGVTYNINYGYGITISPKLPYL